MLTLVRERGRAVYSTEKGRRCPTCGWPQAECRCSKQFDEALPLRVTVVLRLEKKGRAGKSVTVLAGLPRSLAFLEALAKELKRACGCGGSVAVDAVEIQGDQRARVRALLQARQWLVKG
jgi:translation initiation factor 1